MYRTTTDVPLGKVYQTAPGNVAQIISPDQDPSAAGDWGAVADSAGTVRYVPAKDSHGRPYGGAINGAINFRVFDGFSTSDNFGEINFAVDTPPTATDVHSTVREGDTIAFTLAVADPVALLAKANGGVLTTAVAMGGLLIATLSTNIAANIVAPANAFVNLAPSKLSFRLGGIVTAVLGTVICPWRLMADAGGYIFVWLIGTFIGWFSYGRLN